MRPGFVILLAVIFLSPVPMEPCRQAAEPSEDTVSARTAFSPQSRPLRDANIRSGQVDAQKTNAQITTLLANLPLYFIENKGQADSKVRYYTKAQHGAVYFTGEEIVYQFLSGAQGEDRPQEKPFLTGAKVSESDSSTGTKSPIREHTIRMSFVGARQEARLEAQEEQEAKFSYFRGNDPQKWVSGARTFEKVAYRELYPGIDLLVSGREGRMKNEYVAKPGAEPSAIRVKYEGAKALRVNEKGQLEIQTSAGMLIEDVPLSYQIVDGKKSEVRTSYRIADDQTVQFRVARYRKGVELIIDPLTYSTFLGGGGYEHAYGIAVDGGGNVLVTGYTESGDFPTTPGAFDRSFNAGYRDVFITKLNSSGSALLYSTFLGGSGEEEARSIAIDGSGNAYVTGFTASSDFPATSGAYDTSLGGGYDAFVTKLDATGAVLLYSTFLGGSSYDLGRGGAIGIDGSGNAYATGTTCSSDFPTTPGAYDNSYNGNWDIYITKLNSSGSALLFSTFLGGNDYDTTCDMAVDATGDVYVAGYTLSLDFPTTPGAYDISYNGGWCDGFVAKIDSSGNALVYSTYLGGSDEDDCRGIAVDGSGNAYVAGDTLSYNFPTTSGAFDPSPNWAYDGFVAKFNSTGSGLLYSTFLAGGYSDACLGIAVDGTGNACVTGYTNSVDFPTTAGAFDTSFNEGSGHDVFVASLNEAGSALLYSTFLGGSGDEGGHRIAVDGSGNAYITGVTSSGNFPTTSAAYDTGINGSYDVFITKLLPGYPDIRQPISAIDFGNVHVGDSYGQGTIIYNDGSGVLTINSIARISGSAEFVYLIPAAPFGIPPGELAGVLVRFSPASEGAKTAVFNVNSSDPDEPDVTFNVSGTGVAVTEGISVPQTPAGPASGYINKSYTYTAGGSISNLGHDVQYLIDWGDGTDSGWLAVGTPSAQKSWPSAAVYAVRAKARCAMHTAAESSWSPPLSVEIAVGGFDNSPSDYQVIPECVWSPAAGGGTWVSEVQITDVIGSSGGSVVSVYFNYGGGNRRGPFMLWASPGANHNVKYANILASIDALDSGSFSYYGRVGAVEFFTQAATQKIQVTARTLNGAYSKTFPGLNLTDSNTADITRRMIVQNFVNNATYRSTCGFFNPTPDSVTVEFRLMDESGNLIGSAFSRTLAGHDFQSFSPFNQAGVPYPGSSYDNVVLWVTPTSGAGKVMVFGASANNVSNDPAAHLGAQYQGAYDNAPSNYQVLPECIWTAAMGGGTWVSEVQISDLTGGSVVSVYFDYGGGDRRGPFALWTSPGANHNVKYPNILASMDALDPGDFTYYGRIGAVEFLTQDASHKIQVAARTANGSFSKTFPGLNPTDSNTADIERRMIIQNATNNSAYRTNCGIFNPTADFVTVEFRLINEGGGLCGSAFSRTLLPYDFQSFSPFTLAGVPNPSSGSPNDNVVLWVTPTSGNGRVMVYGASANNSSNDPAAHIAVQYK